jgi:hypothetical protein
MRAGFAQFTAFSQDVKDNEIFQRTKLTMPVLAIGGEKSFGATEAVVMRNVAVDVTGAVVPGSGHWLKEENPTATVTLIRDFLKGHASAAARAVQLRLGSWGRKQLQAPLTTFPPSSNRLPCVQAKPPEKFQTLPFHDVGDNVLCHSLSALASAEVNFWFTCRRKRLVAQADGCGERCRMTFLATWASA